MSLPEEPSQLNRVSNPVTIHQPKTDWTFQVYRQGQNLYQSLHKLDSGGKEMFRIVYKLEYVIGSGLNGQSYLVRRDGALFQAPLSYYSRAAQWDFSPGFESSPVGFNRPILPACLACHSGRANPVPQKIGFYQEPAFSELAIGCENCHGPGELHVSERARGLEAPKTGDLTIVNPKRLPGWLADNICMHCHQTGDTRVLNPGKDLSDFRPGTPLNDTLGIFRAPYRRESPPDDDLLEHYSSMVLSRCYQQTKGQLSCISCHSPHSEPGPEDRAAYFRDKCLGCHTRQSCSVAPSQRRQAQDDCAACHLPKRVVKTIAHSALTNHRILARQGQALPEVAFQPSKGLPAVVHVNAVPGQEQRPVPLLTQLQVYGELLSQEPEYQTRYLAVLESLSGTASEHPLVLSALARKAKLEGTPDGDRRTLELLSKAISLGTTSVTDFQDLADLHARAGKRDEAIDVLRQGIALAPFNAGLYKALALQYIQGEHYLKALEIMRRYLTIFPEDEFMRQLLLQAERAPMPQGSPPAH
ncbi:MAG: cytochrome c3 family protein [Acidobacteriota bacterium]